MRRPVRSPLLAAGQQASEERFVERVRLFSVHARQRGATDEGLHAEVIELVRLRAQVSDDVAQALQAGELSEAEGRRSGCACCRRCSGQYDARQVLGGLQALH